MKKKRALPDLISLFLKFLLVIIFPLQIYGGEILDLFVLPTTGFLFTPISYGIEFMPESVWFTTGFTTLIRNFGIGIFLAFPGMIFSYKLARAPVNKSYWKRGVGTAAGLFGLVFALSMIISLTMFDPISYYNESLWILGQNIRNYSSLVFAVFIVLPIVQRQAVIIGSPKYLHDYSMRDLESSPKLSLTREKVLSGIMWTFLCFAPFAIGGNMFYWGGVPFSGLVMSYYFGSYGEYLYDIQPYYLQASVVVADFTFLPFTAFTCIFQFMFVRDIYRYLSKSITKQRLMGIAILSIFGPLLLSTSVLSFAFGYSFASIPLPVLQIAGFLVVRYHRPIADEVDRVWEDDESTMWWEKPRKKREPPVISTPEKPQRNNEHEMITVPFHYFLLSKLREINHRGN